MKTFFTIHITSCEKHSTEWRLPAATVTTDAKPHAQQQLARDLEVEVIINGVLPLLLYCNRRLTHTAGAAEVSISIEAVLAT